VLTDRDVVVLKLALERSVLDAASYLKVLELLQRGERLGLGLRQAGVSGTVVGDLVAAADLQAQTGTVLTRSDAEDTLMRRFLLSTGVSQAQVDEADRELKRMAETGQFSSLDEVFVNRGWLDLMLAVTLRKRVRERLATCGGCFRHFLLQPNTRKVRCPACQRVVRAGEGRSAVDACRALLTESQQQANESPSGRLEPARPASHTSGAHRVPATGAYAAAPPPATGAYPAVSSPAPPGTGAYPAVPSPAPPGTGAYPAAQRRTEQRPAAQLAAPTPRPGSLEAPASIPLDPGPPAPRPRKESTRLRPVPEVQLPGLPGVSDPADTASGSSHDDLEEARTFDESSMIEQDALGLSQDAVARFGPYEIILEVARGAMGIVYKARRTGGDQQLVALKVLMAGEKATPKQVARFEREAEAVRRFAHPGIVKIIETGAHQGYHYIAMEFVEGDTLEKRIKAGALPPVEAARIIAGLADALGCIHTGGVVHRDLKPGNIMVGPDGAPKLIDFGLAKLVEEERLTRTGVMVGTPFYMAPEQVRGQGERVGPRSDVYALGAILFETVTGRPPFTGSNYGELFAAIVNKDPPTPSELKPDLPPALDAIILRCLAREPDERYGSAQALRADLERFLEGSRPVAARQDVLRGVGRVLRAVALAVSVVAVLTIVAYLGHLLPGRDAASDPAPGQQVETLCQEARSQLVGGNHQAAARLLTAARTLDPQRADLAVLLGRCLVATGETDAGVEQLQEAAALGWRDATVLDAKELAPVQADPRVKALREAMQAR
jgi:hypothetical protein